MIDDSDVDNLLIDRSAEVSVSESDEAWFREYVDEVAVVLDSHRSVLHYPVDGEPLCRFRENTTEWTVQQIDEYPPGHRDVCKHCFKELVGDLDE